MNALIELDALCTLLRNPCANLEKELKSNVNLVNDTIKELEQKGLIKKDGNIYALTDKGTNKIKKFLESHLSKKEVLILHVLKHKPLATVRYINKWTNYSTHQSLKYHIRKLQILGYVTGCYKISKKTLRPTQYFSLTELGASLLQPPVDNSQNAIEQEV